MKITKKTIGVGIWTILIALMFSVGFEFGEKPVLVVEAQALGAKENYLAAVTYFSSSLENITFAEVKNQILSSDQPVFISKTIEQEAEELFGVEKFSAHIQIKDAKDIDDSLNQKEGVLGILPWSEVNFRVKTLAVDNVWLWDKNADLAKYPLKYLSVGENYLQEFSSKKVIDLTAAGEMIMARKTADRIKAYNSCDWPFDKVRDTLSAADFTIATLEAPFYSDYNFSITGMVFQVDPACVAGVVNSGIDLVSVAANHLGDAGQAGILETLSLLDKNKILHVGGGQNKTDAHQPALKEINGVKFAFLGYNDVPPGSYAADDNSAGSAWIDIDQITEDVTEAKKQADVVVALMHWGVEYTNFPNSNQQEAARVAFDAGADLIVGDHPHWVQGLEFMGDKSGSRFGYTTYGIGNFVFDQMWSTETMQGSIQQFVFYGKNLVSATILPTQIEDWGQPRIMGKDEGQAVLDRIWEASKY